MTEHLTVKDKILSHWRPLNRGSTVFQLLVGLQIHVFPIQPNLYLAIMVCTYMYSQLRLIQIQLIRIS